MKLKFFAPLAVFFALVIVFYSTIDRDIRAVPSPLIGKPAPEFKLPDLFDPTSIISPKTMLGKPWILNVWASWCRECQVEHPLFNRLANQHNITIVGLNYKDASRDAKQWLANLGNPYDKTLYDDKGLAGLDWGVYGVPETFVIDSTGMILYKHIGGVNQTIIDKEILPFFVVHNNAPIKTSSMEVVQ